LLDVGCGLGYFVKAVSRLPHWSAYGYDLSKPAVDFARSKLQLETVFHGKVEESGFERKSFDVITLWDVIEHIPDPDPLISYLFYILNDDGMLFIHTPNVLVQLPKARLKKLISGMKPGTHYLEARDHANLYSPRTIAQVLGRNGFTEIDFVHLRPIQSMAGSRDAWRRFTKNIWFHGAVALYWLSVARVNLDNLFVVARRGSEGYKSTRVTARVL